MAAVKSRRPYRSRLRAEQAAQTRLRILEAAGELFAERGYIATTIDAVAAEAAVSVDTVYAIFGSKKRLLSAVVDLRVTGSAENGINGVNDTAASPRLHKGGAAGVAALGKQFTRGLQDAQRRLRRLFGAKSGSDTDGGS